MSRVFRVYMQRESPSPSWRAWRLRTKGVLVIDGGEVEFRSGSGDTFALPGIRSVGKGWRNHAYGKSLIPVVDTWIEVVYGDKDHPSVMYFNDSRWLGLGVYLPHRPLLAALQGSAN